MTQPAYFITITTATAGPLRAWENAGYPIGTLLRLSSEGDLTSSDDVITVI